MATQFNLYVDADASLRFQLVTGNGDVLLTSDAFADEDAAIAAIWSVREAAAKGRIVDLTSSGPETTPPANLGIEPVDL
ncbi:DUF1508 domain-containing protein [Arthrobacter sp. CJ23]|uniref:DUF1508 domain-containing protein n=1 Tax=Arthrobacter sp. CJ23 TaxID=2972479 RepID=UPI00215CE8FB|nr:DUF1508 domain-containing protein [Arthrobacter sp. CJ23]UVJ38779.1 DUF1508 domain-containing protein [Arthrobacter sp. CJ23]